MPQLAVLSALSAALVHPCSASLAEVDATADPPMPLITASPTGKGRDTSGARHGLATRASTWLSGGKMNCRGSCRVSIESVFE